jgi:classical protein kinase C/novel protein kinase C epsilon type
MLNQLQFKLQVEEQYKLGIEKMAQAYRAEGDKRLRSETEAKRVESDGKIQLLRKAKRRYETLAKFGGAVEDDEGKWYCHHVDMAKMLARSKAMRYRAMAHANRQIWYPITSEKTRSANPSRVSSSSLSAQHAT